MGFGFGFGLMDTLFPVLFFGVFAVVIIMFIVIAVKGLSQWHSNNQSPRLTVKAKVVSRHADVSVHHHHGENNMHHTTSSTTHYVVFQVESGDRMEFVVPDREYGFLVEGDRGNLTFQGTRYLGFERTGMA